jgi:hypothetical protein
MDSQKGKYRNSVFIVIFIEEYLFDRPLCKFERYCQPKEGI